MDRYTDAVDIFHPHTPMFETLSFMLRTVRVHLDNLIRNDRGDVPGWVLITLMTAGLVIVIWGLAGPALSEIFGNAISKVVGL